MILCVYEKSLKRDSKNLQRKIDLEEVLSTTKYFSEILEARSNGYVPLDFAVSIRSMYSNKVVETTTEIGNKIYYTNLQYIQEFPHKGLDLVMYLCSIGVLHNVNYSPEFDKVMLEHSQFIPMGLFYFSELINPIIYSHIILSDIGMEMFENYLKVDRKVIDIKDIDSEYCLQALTDTLIEVKEERGAENE